MPLNALKETLRVCGWTGVWLSCSSVLLEHNCDPFMDRFSGLTMNLTFGCYPCMVSFIPYPLVSLFLEQPAFSQFIGERSTLTLPFLAVIASLRWFCCFLLFVSLLDLRSESPFHLGPIPCSAFVISPGLV